MTRRKHDEDRVGEQRPVERLQSVQETMLELINLAFVHHDPVIRLRWIQTRVDVSEDLPKSAPEQVGSQNPVPRLCMAIDEIRDARPIWIVARKRHLIVLDYAALAGGPRDLATWLGPVYNRLAPRLY